ncbi:hypothetical protein SUDANB176_02363 [Streptomyces sp. enrichment culture]
MTGIRFQLTHTGSDRGRPLRRATHTWTGTLPGLGAAELVCPSTWGPPGTT